MRRRTPYDQLPILAVALVFIGTALNIWPEQHRMIGAITIGFAIGWMIFEVALHFRDRE